MILKSLNYLYSFKISQFLVFGLFSGLICYLLYLFLGKLIGYKSSYIIAFIFNTFLNYVLNKKIFNKNLVLKIKNFFIYYIYYVFSALISFYIFYILLDLIKISYYFTPFLVLVFVTPLNYFFNAKFFKNN